uniref:Procollagen C-endopeptidase enhancer 2 n=1 Tax=Sinocyclocheilus grahami TaxID=75366 RepID=A0A672PNJ9_SINGR
AYYFKNKYCIWRKIRITHMKPVFTCGGNFTGDTGLIGSQGYLGVYPPNNKCVWRITVPQGRVVSLLFRALDLESDSICRYDFVDVYEDGHINGQCLGRFCGTAKPGALVTNGKKMQVVMVSDANTAGSGFLALYSVIRPNERDHITSHASLTIIELKFEKFDVERDSYCRYDHVAVFNGGETNESRKIGKFCGDSPPMTIDSDGNHLFIKFLSDLSLTADGFIGHYRFKSWTLSTATLTYSEGLCKQKCKSHYCSSNFVITATLISAAMRDHSVLATFSIMHLYKVGSLAIQQAGKTMSTKVTVLCKKCPLVRRGEYFRQDMPFQRHGVIIIIFNHMDGI